MSQAKTQKNHHHNHNHQHIFHYEQDTSSFNNNNSNEQDQQSPSLSMDSSSSSSSASSLTSANNNNNNNDNMTWNHFIRDNKLQQQSMITDKNQQQKSNQWLSSNKLQTTTTNYKQHQQQNGWESIEQQQQQQEWITKNQNNSNANANSASSRSWAKIVQQQTTISSQNQQLATTTLTTTNAQSSLNNNNILTNSNNTNIKPSLSPNVNINNNNNNQSSSSIDWDIKVNQQVPWTINDIKNQNNSTNIVPTHHQQLNIQHQQDQSLLSSSTSTTTSSSMKTKNDTTSDLWPTSTQTSQLLTQQNSQQLFWPSSNDTNSQNIQNDDKENLQAINTTNTNWPNTIQSQWSKPSSTTTPTTIINKRNYQESPITQWTINNTAGVAATTSDQQLPQTTNDIYQRQWSNSQLQQQQQQQWSTSNINDEQKPLQQQSSNISSPVSTTPSWNSKQGPIEPSGWDEPDAKIAKKVADDGTSIWGDPDQARLVKIQKWTYNTKHVPNLATLKSNNEHQNDQQQQQNQNQQQQQQQQSQLINSHIDNNTTCSYQSQHLSNVPHLSQAPIGQQLNKTLSNSNWNNTPVAPHTQQFSTTDNLTLNDANNNNNGKDDWSIGQVDTTSWFTDSNKTEPKNNFDPSVGVIDTSKWFNTSTTTTTTNTSTLQSTPPTMHSKLQSHQSTSSDWPFNSRTQPLNTQTSGVGQAHSFITRVPSNPQMQVPQTLQSSANIKPNQLSSNNLSQQPQTQPLPQTPGLPAGQTPHIQSQLIESFRLAVQHGLISPDLLNIKLPQEVLTMLHQLFQYQTQLMNCNQKLENLNKRRQTMTQMQYKAEYESTQRDSSALKEILSNLKQKIDQAYTIIKSKSSQLQSPIVQTTTTTFGLHGSDSPLTEPLNQLRIGTNSTNNETNASKLVQLLVSNDLIKSRPQSIAVNNGQSTLQNSQTAKQYQPFGPTIQNSWPSFPNDFDVPQINDDHITPFIPGQPWSRPSPTSIEEDPHCTPGSASRSLLDQVGIDPELRLGNLHAKTTWPETQTTNTLINSQRQQRPSWSSTPSTGGIFNHPQQHQTQQSQIGEQLWGINRQQSQQQQQQQPQSRIPSGQLSRTLSQPQQQQQQQFYRNNSWNLNSPQQTQQSWNSPTMATQYLLIKNVKVEQNILRTICSQHGALAYFRCSNGFAIVKYNSKEEASSAQAKLNNTPLNNSYIQTQFISENEAKEYDSALMSQGWPQSQQFQSQQPQTNFHNNQFNRSFNTNNQQQQQQQNRWNSNNLNGFNQQYNQWNTSTTNTGWSTSTSDSLLNPSPFLQDD